MWGFSTGTGRAADVNTEDAAGRRRLRQIARQCVNYGQRVQCSVFECLLDAAQGKLLQAKLLSIMDQEKDSLQKSNLRRSPRGERRLKRHLLPSAAPPDEGGLGNRCLAGAVNGRKKSA